LQGTLEYAISTRDNRYASQEQVDTATYNLRAATNALVQISGISPATITGPSALELRVGYSATNKPGFIVIGNPTPAITLSGNPGGLITWHDAHSRLNIAAGIPIGTYYIVLTAYNGVGEPDTHTFVLTVSNQVAVCKELLITAIAAAELFTGNGFTRLTWALLQDALTHARLVVNNEYATQIQVDAALTRLNLAKANRQVVINRELLNAAISEAESRNQQIYTEDTWANLQGALEYAKFIRDDSYASQEQVDTATYNLLAAINALVQISGVSPATITGPSALELRVGYSATNKPGFIVTGNPTPAITLSGNPGGLITWHDAHSQVNIAAGIPIGTYNIVLTAYNGVGEPDTHTFVLTVSNQVVICKELLNAAIAVAELFLVSEFNRLNWVLLQDALTHARLVVNNEHATQVQVDAALTRLNSAKANRIT